MKNIEFLALAVATMNNALEPGSYAFRQKNPGLLRDECNGVRVFATWAGGFRSLVSDLGSADPSSTLRTAFEKYGLSRFEHEMLVYDFLARAFDKPVNRDTRLEEICA